MSDKYLIHLGDMYSRQTFVRKVEYLKYNLRGILPKKPTKDYSVLEIGPGMGECLSYLNELGIKNIDIVDNDSNILKSSAEFFQTRKAIFSQDLTRLSQKLGEYDLIIMIQVLEHIPTEKHKKTMQVLYSHLKKNGSIAVVVPNAGNPLGLVERYGDLQHTTAFTQQSLKDLVNYSNLDSVQVAVRGFEIPPYNILNIIRIIFQKILHAILLLALVVNGGIFFGLMTPNIMLVLKSLQRRPNVR